MEEELSKSVRKKESEAGESEMKSAFRRKGAAHKILYSVDLIIQK